MSDSANFEPNGNQAAYLNYCQECNYRCSNREAADAVGIDESAARRWWEHDTGFSEWWDAKYKAHFSRRRARWSGQLDAAATGEGACDVPAVKTLLELYDPNYCPKSQVRNADANGQPLQAPINLFFVGAQPAQLAEKPENQPIPEKTAAQDAPGSTISDADDPQADREDVLS